MLVRWCCAAAPGAGSRSRLAGRGGAYATLPLLRGAPGRTRCRPCSGLRRRARPADRQRFLRLPLLPCPKGRSRRRRTGPARGDGLPGPGPAREELDRQTRVNIWRVAGWSGKATGCCWTAGTGWTTHPDLRADHAPPRRRRLLLLRAELLEDCAGAWATAAPEHRPGPGRRGGAAGLFTWADGLVQFHLSGTSESTAGPGRQDDAHPHAGLGQGAGARFLHLARVGSGGLPGLLQAGFSRLRPGSALRMVLRPDLYQTCSGAGAVAGGDSSPATPPRPLMESLTHDPGPP